MNDKKADKSGEHLRISRFRWVIGAPYFVQGTSSLTEIPILYFIVKEFASTFMNIAHTADERTLILQMFVYISLFFTLLTIPFIELLRRELDRRKVEISLGKGA